jgi:hypothetical protein
MSNITLSVEPAAGSKIPATAGSGRQHGYLSLKFQGINDPNIITAI